MTLSKESNQSEPKTEITAAKKRRIRRKRLRAAKQYKEVQNNICYCVAINTNKQTNSIDLRQTNSTTDLDNNILNKSTVTENKSVSDIKDSVRGAIEMLKEQEKSRDEVLAAREAKKLAKLKAKKKNEDTGNSVTKTQDTPKQGKNEKKNDKVEGQTSHTETKIDNSPNKDKDEVDRAVIIDNEAKENVKEREIVLAQRAAKKSLKGKKIDMPSEQVINATVNDVVNTLKDIVTVAREVKEVTDKVKAIDLGKKSEESQKSKAELKAERRAKQEAQRAAKQKEIEAKAKKTAEPPKPKEEKPVKTKVPEKPKPKMQKMNWFQNVPMEHEKEALKKIAINSNLHPAVIKLGVQLASRVVTGSNARCIAFLDALKKVVRDYSLPAKTEFARGLESQLAACVDFLWSMRHPAASQTNALKHFRHHLTQLPNNVDEFDAKKRLQEEIDRYIREQIDMAGEAISIAVRNKITPGDTILTYGCSSLIERILCEAHAAGVCFSTVVVGERGNRGPTEMLRRLATKGLNCVYADLSALSYVMKETDKVLVGAACLLASGAVVGAAGTLQTALLAKANNVPLLVACETHKFSDTVHTDAMIYHETGDPEDLIDKTDENSPLKDWQSNPNLNLLNLTYDVTPPSLVTAVVTELAILPCTSAPVVLRFKLSEYGI
nr:translation initiation factor eIF-2B subunit delta [Danaus plexippus plexippus]